MYDIRIKQFGEEAEVLNRKAITAYKYYKNEQGKYPELKALFQKAFDMNGNDFYSGNLTAYMDVLRRYKLTGGEMTDDQVFEIYFKVTDVIDYQKANGGDTREWKRAGEIVDKLILDMTVTVDCEFVETTSRT